jgi:hypothetical protein
VPRFQSRDKAKASGVKVKQGRTSCSSGLATRLQKKTGWALSVGSVAAGVRDGGPGGAQQRPPGQPPLGRFRATAAWRITGMQ